MTTEEERQFRLRPRKPRTGRTRGAPMIWATAFKAVMRYGRMHGKARAGKRSSGASRPTSHRFHQRSAVRVTYSRNTVKGQWRAHGRYIARESATREKAPGGSGFDGHNESVDVVARLDSWQRDGDERMWKFIVSPEFGDRIDLQRLTRELIHRVENNLGESELEWTAVAHYNTEHPHVHVALRGVNRQGVPVRFRREFIKQEIREIAGNLCTQQLGYRTEMDAEAAERREVNQCRFTSLDRAIGRSAGSAPALDDPPDFFRVISTEHGARRPHPRHIVERLMALQRMGLAEAAGSGSWHVRQDYESVLRSMQRVTDRQKMLAAHGVVVSDERLPVTQLDWRDITTVEGRVLVHGEEEDGRGAGRSYLMLEGTDASVHHIYYTPEMEELRDRGGLRVNSFIRLRQLFVEGSPEIEIEELGTAEAILRNRPYLKGVAQQLIRKGMTPEEDGWGGWLGRYRAAVRKTVLEVQQERESREIMRQREREGDRSGSRGHGR